MIFRTLRWTIGIAVIAMTFTGCSQKADTAAEKAATDVKDKVVADAKAAEALVKEKEAKDTGIEAYIYAYPLVTMELTRRVSTNVAAPEGSKAPMGQFAKLRGYPAVDDHTVTAPNADTLYTIAWLDVSKEPWIVSAPDMKGRYFLLPMLDGWTTVFADPGQAHHGHRRTEIRDHRPGLDRNTSRRRQGIQVGDRHGVAARPALLHWHARGLQGGARAAGQDDGRAAVRLWQALHARRREPSTRAST